jgi:hypothetical protein
MEDFLFIGKKDILIFEFENGKTYYRIGDAKELDSNRIRWFSEHNENLNRLTTHDKHAYEKEYRRMFENGISMRHAGIIAK